MFLQKFKKYSCFLGRVEGTVTGIQSGAVDVLGATGSVGRIRAVCITNLFGW